MVGKNKRAFCGLPLWMWSWAQAKRLAGPDDQVMVSSDDPEIYSVVGGMPRAAKWCTDDAVITDMIETLMVFDSVCLLQATSPTRSDSLVRAMVNRGDSCRSVTDGEPNGQCWVVRPGKAMVDVTTERGHDINVLSEFEAAESDMRRRFL